MDCNFECSYFVVVKSLNSFEFVLSTGDWSSISMTIFRHATFFHCKNKHSILLIISRCIQKYEYYLNQCEYNVRIKENSWSWETPINRFARALLHTTKMIMMSELTWYYAIFRVKITRNLLAYIRWYIVHQIHSWRFAR